MRISSSVDPLAFPMIISETLPERVSSPRQPLSFSISAEAPGPATQYSSGSRPMPFALGSGSSWVLRASCRTALFSYRWSRESCTTRSACSEPSMPSESSNSSVSSDSSESSDPSWLASQLSSLALPPAAIHSSGANRGPWYVQVVRTSIKNFMVSIPPSNQSIKPSDIFLKRMLLRRVSSFVLKRTSRYSGIYPPFTPMTTASSLFTLSLKLIPKTLKVSSTKFARVYAIFGGQRAGLSRFST